MLHFLDGAALRSTSISTVSQGGHSHVALTQDRVGGHSLFAALRSTVNEGVKIGHHGHHSRGGCPPNTLRGRKSQKEGIETLQPGRTNT